MVPRPDQLGRRRASPAGGLGGPAELTRRDWRRAKRLGFADAQLAWLWSVPEDDVRAARLAAGVRATMKTVDTCAAEFEARTPYHYSTYEDDDEVRAERPAQDHHPRVGSQPHRPRGRVRLLLRAGQLRPARRRLRDGHDQLQPRDRLHRLRHQRPPLLRAHHLGGRHQRHRRRVGHRRGGRGDRCRSAARRPLKLAGLLPAGLVLGTSPASIDLAEDRERWNALCSRLEIPQPAGGTAATFDEARAIVDRIGYPALVRPSYVLGGRAMEIVYDEEDLARAMGELAGFGSLGREGGLSAERPVLVDRFLEDAIEVDVDAVRDATGEVLIGAVMEHVEEAGVHSGDSACVIPPPTLSASTVAVIEGYIRDIAAALACGRPAQRAVRGQGPTQVFVIEANPRASRTVPFVSKATGVPLAKVGARVMAGATLAELREPRGCCVPR